MKTNLSIVLVSMVALSLVAGCTNINKSRNMWNAKYTYAPIVSQPIEEQHIEFQIDDSKAFIHSKLCLEDLTSYPADSDMFLAEEKDDVKTIYTVNGFILDQDITYDRDMILNVTLTQKSSNGSTSIYLNDIKQVIVNSEGVTSTYTSNNFTNRQYEHYMPIIKSFLEDYKKCLETHDLDYHK